MRNIELKARLADRDAAREVARSLCGTPPKDLMRQTDTYFSVERGRLKLREITRDGGETSAELISYRRDDVSGPKSCTYSIAPVTQPTGLKQTLAHALGIRQTVSKTRTLFLYRYVRIHIDSVDELGAFIEFEAVLRDESMAAEGEELVDELTGRFGIRQTDLIEGSYVDLLEDAGRHPSA